MKPVNRSSFLLLFILFTGWVTSIAIHGDTYSINQDKFYDSKIQVNEGSDDLDALEVVVVVSGGCDAYCSIPHSLTYSITQSVLLLEARAPPRFL